METFKQILVVAMVCGLAACGMRHDETSQPVETHVAANPTKFEVFFDTGHATLGEAAQKTLRLAATNARQGNVHRVTVSTHPHENGWDLPSEALAAQRADAVKAALVADGIPTAEIEYVGIAKDPLLQTDDGVHDPENRRTEINLR